MKTFRILILFLLLAQAGCLGMNSNLTEFTNPITGQKIKCPTPKDKEVVRQVTASGAVDTKTKRIEEISATANISLEQKIINMREVIPNFQTFEEVDFRMCAANAQGQISNEQYQKWLNEFKDKILLLIKPKVSTNQEMVNSPGGIQIGNVDSMTLNQNATSDEAVARLQSEIEKFLHFPNGVPDTLKPPTLIETLVVNKLPGRLFDLLMTYREKDVMRVPKIGDGLHSYIKNYYNFRQKSLTLEDSLTTQIGQMVTVRFRNAWAIYLEYIIMRFGGQTKEAIISGGNFLNYDITWDDTERVFTKLSNDPTVTHEFSEIFALYKNLGEDVGRFSTGI